MTPPARILFYAPRLVVFMAPSLQDFLAVLGIVGLAGDRMDAVDDAMQMHVRLVAVGGKNDFMLPVSQLFQ